MSRKPEQLIQPHPDPFRAKLFEIIFEADTPAGKAFDVILLWAILISIIAVLLESVTAFRLEHGALLRTLEWVFTILFSLEYIVRLICVKRPHRYALSFFGIVDFCAIIPTYLSLFLIGAQSLLVIRTLRLLRVFRVLKLGRYLSELEMLIKALKESRDKIMVFLFVVFSLTIIMGTMMYLIEGEANGFTSIPKSIYWAIVTMTTVGYGDIAPKTVLGQILASFSMILGYAIIVVPTGIFSVALTNVAKAEIQSLSCSQCGHDRHQSGAVFCHLCGAKL